MPSIERGVTVAARTVSGAPGCFTHQHQIITTVSTGTLSPLAEIPGPGNSVQTLSDHYKVPVAGPKKPADRQARRAHAERDPLITHNQVMSVPVFEVITLDLDPVL